MIQRILTYLLAVAIFAYGTAWAFGGPDCDVTGHSFTSAQWTPHDADHAGAGCDHCCHVTTHLVGLHQHLPVIGQPSGNRLTPVASDSVATCTTAPLLRPPRS